MGSAIFGGLTGAVICTIIYLCLKDSPLGYYIDENIFLVAIPLGVVCGGDVLFFVSIIPCFTFYIRNLLINSKRNLCREMQLSHIGKNRRIRRLKADGLIIYLFFFELLNILIFLWQIPSKIKILLHYLYRNKNILKGFLQ